MREISGFLILSTLFVSTAVAQQAEQLEDAWWTGPILASSAATLTAGHVLIEPYVFDIETNSAIDQRGRRNAVSEQHFVGSQTYLLFGLTDDLTTGIIDRVAFHQSGGDAPATGVQQGDLTLHTSYRLNRFGNNRWPDVSLVLEETLPTGRYDELDNGNDGTGSGVYSTALALYTQYYSWLPNGRILRTRFDVTYTHSGSALLRDLSVYGTNDGFRGSVRPGDSFNVDAAAEYSISRRWVFAVDIVYFAGASTLVDGVEMRDVTRPDNIKVSTGNFCQIGYVPALEYNFSPRVGMIAGVRVLEIGRNTSGSITPVVALNVVF